MTKNLIINEGEIIFVRSSSILAKLIQLAENLFNYLNFQKREKQFNHCALGLESGLVSEALAEGIKIRDFSKAYGDSKRKELLIYSIPTLSEEQKKHMSAFAREFENRPYQFDNFILNLKSILKRDYQWPEAPEDAAKRLYCSEYVCMVVFEITKDSELSQWWKMRPDMLLDIARKKWKLERRYTF